jgi:hypothetical protein
MPLTTVEISPILREMGSKNWDRKAMVNAHPLMATIPNDTESMVGDYFKIPVNYAKPAGRSHSSTVAYDNEDGSRDVAFKVTPVTDYLTFRLHGGVVRKAKRSNDSNSFENALKREVFLALEGAGDNIAKEAYLNAGGYRARVHPTIAISTTSLTLANPADAVHFYPGMRVGASADDGTTGSLRGSPTYVTIVSVALETGVLVANANWSTISSIAANDYLFAEGDFGAACTGLESWNPSSAPGATAFWTVDRSVAPAYLGGMRYNGSSDSIETVFIKADRLFSLQHGNPFKQAEVFMNPMSVGGLRIAKEGSRFIDSDNEYGIGIEKFRTASGHVIVEDRDCPVGVARVIGKGCFMHCTTGKQPALADVEGIEMVYDNRNDAYTATVVIDHNFASEKPNGLGRITLPSEAYA